MRDGITDLRRTALVVACVITMFLAVLVLVASPAVAQENAAEEQYAPGPDGECPGAKVVSITKSAGSTQTPPFPIAGERFRVTITLNAATDDAQNAFVDVTVQEADNDDFVTTISQDGNGTKSSIVNAGPGDFFLDITGSVGDAYNITVEDCVDTEGNPPVSPGDTNNPGDVDEGTIPNKPLPNTGGLPLVGLVVLGLALLGVGSSIMRAGIGRRS